MTAAIGSRAAESGAIDSVAIIIPARDEERLLPRCLKALGGAIDELLERRPRIAVRTVVVADRSTDGTLMVVAADDRVEAVVVQHGNVGAARRSGAAYVFGDAAWRTAGTWLVTTDADSIVPRDWLVKHVDHAEEGADAVIGTVTPEFEGLSREQIDAWKASHPPGEPNGHVHGANLGIRGSVYLAVDGFHPRAVGEDVDLVARIAERGFAVVPSARLDVTTSSRVAARAPGGYASWLHDGGLMPVSRLVEPEL
jgi:glycosyltransferase involved in cell wall biosynthesis